MIDLDSKKISTISLRINITLYTALQDYLSAMHNVSNYTFGSISNLLRYILSQLKENGLHNDQINYSKNAECMEVILRVNYEEKQFWKSLPHRNKRQIIERAVAAFIKHKTA